MTAPDRFDGEATQPGDDPSDYKWNCERCGARFTAEDSAKNCCVAKDRFDDAAQDIAYDANVSAGGEFPRLEEKIAEFGRQCDRAARQEHTLGDLRRANEIRQREWDKDGGISAEYRGNELAGEVGEACNIIKKLARERLGIRGSRATVGQLADELADVVICVDLIAMQFGVDLGSAVTTKFNATSEKYGLATRIAERAGRGCAAEVIARDIRVANEKANGT